MNISFESVESCPVCASGESSFLTETRDRLHRLPGKFALVRCDSCSLVRLSPRPTNESLGFYYPEDDYYSYQVMPEDLPRELSGFKAMIRASVLSGLGYETAAGLFLKFLRPFASLFFFERATYGLEARLPRFVEGGKALDVGCGSGKYLNLLKFLGWDVKGIEMSERGAKTAKEMFDIEVFVGELKDCPYEKNSFDFINMSHVIEHFPDPLEAMNSVASLLKPGGVVYIETPNLPGAANAKRLSIWFPTDSPRHLFLFSPETLSDLISRSGLSVKKIECKHANFTEWEELYEIEDSIDAISPERDALRTRLRGKTWGRRLVNKILCKLNPRRGDTLRCWVSSS